ncbi:hypothetical protein LEP1GSC187_0600 [Leptospira santarosai str. ZUN179]|uniref:Uncharacterized protein n=1 Tax=Leptospira santarosai str. ZUN179 TaxID=1049985 RepID=M6V9B8_9LEPT|nr:hypothetical protein LEP1GSC187_0600 [Leptospira santarosai str. ZUN179]
MIHTWNFRIVSYRISNQYNHNVCFCENKVSVSLKSFYSHSSLPTTNLLDKDDELKSIL